MMVVPGIMTHGLRTSVRSGFGVHAGGPVRGEGPKTDIDPWRAFGMSPPGIGYVGRTTDMYCLPRLDDHR